MRVDLATQVCIHVIHLSGLVCIIKSDFFIGDKLNGGRCSTLNWRRGSQGDGPFYSAGGQVLNVNNFHSGKRSYVVLIIYAIIQEC